MKKEKDLYSEYLLSSFRQVTAPGLSKLSGGILSQDKITYLLSENELIVM